MFWKLQLSIIAQLRIIRSLSAIVAIVIPNHDGRSIQAFIRGLTAAHWKVESWDVAYPDIGDSVADSCCIITAIHLSCALTVKPIVLKTPPCLLARPISSFIWEPFNRPKHSLCYGCNDVDFNKDESSPMIASTPKPAVSTNCQFVNIKYHLHRGNANGSILAGSSVLSGESLCPPFEACPNQNLFQNYFGIEFHHDGHTYARAISTYKFTRCFGLLKRLQYQLSHESYKFELDASMPSKMSAWLFEQVHSHLVNLRDSNSEVFLTNQFAAPAATIQTLVNGATCTCLPLQERWLEAYHNDVELSAVHNLVLNPSLICNQSLSKINHNYCGPLRQLLISVEDDMLILKEPIGGTLSYMHLQLVPRELFNVLFVAFHTNVMGSHLNAYQTLHHL